MNTWYIYMREKWKYYDDMESNLKETEMYSLDIASWAVLLFFPRQKISLKLLAFRIYFLLRVFNPSKFPNLVAAVSPRCSVSTIGGNGNSGLNPGRCGSHFASFRSRLNRRVSGAKRARISSRDTLKLRRTLAPKLAATAVSFHRFPLPPGRL